MFFNSFEFLVYFPVVVMLHFLSGRYQWLILLLASYYFYMAWKPEYVVLLLLSTVVDYSCARRMEKLPAPILRRPYLLISLASNLGILFVFKYANFFLENASGMLAAIGGPASSFYINVVLPMGISFYTFQTLSYSIDVYKGRIPAEKHFGIFALFVSFFPQLVAGPIERAGRLLPQFLERRRFDYSRAVEGLQLMLLGLFKKLFVADRVAKYVNEVYGNPGGYHGFCLVIATLFFAFQIYCDFSGYSDIARGAARVMGYDLQLNFRRPYFASSIGDFWRRWHISLSSWFRDYVYFPLGGNRVNRARLYLNLAVVFLVSGLWHGAAWTFVIWGAIHATLVIAENALRSRGLSISSKLPAGASRMVGVFFTFAIVCVAWVFFRAESLADAVVVLKGMVSFSSYELSQLGFDAIPYVKKTVFAYDVMLSWIGVITIVAVDICAARGVFGRLSAGAQGLVCAGAIVVILFAGVFGKNEFIYFQF